MGGDVSIWGLCRFYFELCTGLRTESNSCHCGAYFLVFSFEYPSKALYLGLRLSYTVVHAFYQVSYRESFSDRHNPCCGCCRFLWRVLRRRLHRARWHCRYRCCGRRAYPVGAGKPQRVPLPRADSGTDHPGAEDGTHRAERLRQGGCAGNR